MDVDGKRLTTTPSASGAGLFLAKLSSMNGATVWSKGVSGTGGIDCRSVAAEGNGNIYINDICYSVLDVGFDPFRTAGGSGDDNSNAQSGVYITEERLFDMNAE